jgi:uncharacterized protein (TIGR04141 family)
MTSTRTKINKFRTANDAQPHTRHSTVYLLQDVPSSSDSLREALNLKYEQEHGFEIQDVSIGLSPGLLYTGVIARGYPPEWANAVHRLTDVSPSVANKTAAGTLLVPVDGKVFALTFGMGHLLLDQSRVTPGFGFHFALRVLKPDAVRQVTHSMMDARGRTDRNSAAQDQHIHGFGIEEYGEVVSRLAGKLGETSLTLSKGRKQSVQISGTDALKIHLGAEPNDLLADLAELNRIATTESPAPEFDAIARVRPLKAADERRPELDRKLETLLGDPSAGSIAVTVPTTLLDEEDGAMSFWVKVGPRRESVPELDLEHILVKTRCLQEGERLSALTKGYIQMCRDADGENVASPRIPAHKWLAAEVALGTSHFFLHEGRWYEVGDQHLESIQQQVGTLLQASTGLSLIDWTADLKDEKEYNREAAKHGYVCLDRALIKTDLHPRGFESCDLFGPSNELVHVKRAKSTAPLNHLFAQGRVSADVLHWDSTARSKLLAKVRERNPQHPVEDDFMPRKVIYGISLKSGKPLTVKNLFTFAQVSLLQAAVALRNSGIDVAVVNIPTVP